MTRYTGLDTEQIIRTIKKEYVGESKDLFARIVSAFDSNTKQKTALIIKEDGVKYYILRGLSTENPNLELTLSHRSFTDEPHSDTHLQIYRQVPEKIHKLLEALEWSSSNPFNASEMSLFDHSDEDDGEDDSKKFFGYSADEPIAQGDRRVINLTRKLHTEITGSATAEPKIDLTRDYGDGFDISDDGNEEYEIDYLHNTAEMPQLPASKVLRELKSRFREGRPKHHGVTSLLDVFEKNTNHVTAIETREKAFNVTEYMVTGRFKGKENIIVALNYFKPTKYNESCGVSGFPVHLGIYRSIPKDMVNLLIRLNLEKEFYQITTPTFIGFDERDSIIDTEYVLMLFEYDLLHDARFPDEDVVNVSRELYQQLRDKCNSEDTKENKHTK